MFAIYGLSGQVFRGALEELYRVHAAERSQRVRAISETESESAPQIALSVESAIDAYRAAEHADTERGPLYRAAQIMRRPVIALLGSDSVEHAWRTLVAQRIHQAPVLDGAQRLIGMVGERDLLTVLNVEHGQLRDVLARTVQQVMTSPVVCADPDTDIRRIAQVMLQYGAAGVPIVEPGGGLVGFISRSDILAAVMIDPPLSLWR